MTYYDENWAALLRQAGLPEVPLPPDTPARDLLRDMLSQYEITGEMIDARLEPPPAKRWNEMIKTRDNAIAFADAIAPLVQEGMAAHPEVKQQEIPVDELSTLTRLYKTLGINEEAARKAGYNRLYINDPKKPKRLLRLFWKYSELPARQIAERINEYTGSKLNEHYVINRLISPNVFVRDDFLWQFVDAIKPAFVAGEKEGWLDPKSKKPLDTETILRNKLGENVLDDGWQKERKRFAQGEERARDVAALLYCIRKSGVAETAICQTIGETNNWLTMRKKATDTRNLHLLFPSDVARVADVIKPYIAGTKVWSKDTILVVDNPQWLDNSRRLQEYVIDELKRRLGLEGGREVDAVLALLPEKNGPALARTLGPALKILREEVGLTLHDFNNVIEAGVNGKKGIRSSDLSLFEHNKYTPSCIKEDGTLNDALRQKLDHFVEVVAEHWPMRGKTPGTKVDDATARKTGRGAGRARDGSQ